MIDHGALLGSGFEAAGALDTVGTASRQEKTNLEDSYYSLSRAGPG